MSHLSNFAVLTARLDVEGAVITTSHANARTLV